MLVSAKLRCTEMSDETCYMFGAAGVLTLIVWAVFIPWAIRADGREAARGDAAAVAENERLSNSKSGAPEDEGREIADHAVG